MKQILNKLSLLTLLFLLESRLPAQHIILGESFEATTFPPTGWTAIGGSINRWSRVLNSTFPTVSLAPYGIGFARFQSRGVPAGTNQTIALPVADYRLRGSNTPKVRFLMYRDSLSKNADSISVYINTTNALNGAKLLGQIARYSRLSLPDTQIVNGWYPYSFDIPAAYNGAVNYIMIKATSQAGNNIYLDSFRWDIYPQQCAGKPTGSSISASPSVICGGSGSSVLTLQGGSAGNYGLSVVWQNSATSTGPWSNMGATGLTTGTGNLTATRYYRCLLNCALSGLSDTTPVLTLTVVTTPRPTITVIPPNSNYCVGATPVQLTASGALTYSWSPATGLNVNNKDTVFASPTATTQYVVTGTDANGCTGTASALVNLRQPSNIIIVAADSVICRGDSIRLQAQGGGVVSYSWSPGGETTAAIFAKPANNTRYVVVAKNNFNCASSAGINIYSNQHPVAKFGFTQKGSTYYFHDSSSNARSVSWSFGDGNESTKRNPIYTYTYDSLYEIVMVAYNPPCNNDTFRYLVNNPAGIKMGGSSSRYRLFPNPTENELYIAGTALANEIQITDVEGRLLKSFIANQQTNTLPVKLDVSLLKPGLYIVRIKEGNNQFSSTFIKNR